MTELVARRALLLAGAVALLGGTGDRAAAEQATVRFRGLQVDADPLAARGGGSAAALIRQIMPDKMRAVFGDLLAPGDRTLPLLVARIDTISLPGYGDSREGNLYALQRDTLSGAGLVVSGRDLKGTTPLHVDLPPGYSGAWYLPDIDARRIDALCFQFAYWLRREMQI